MATYQRVVTESAAGTISQATTGNAATATTASAAPYSGLTGSVPTWDQNTAGNAATASQSVNAQVLKTARTIGGVSFNGSANINLPGVNTAGSQSTSGNAATATKLGTARTIGGVSFDGSANISLPGVNTAGSQNTTGNAATATTASAAPYSGLTGSVPTWNQSTTGNAATSTAFATGGKITTTGDVVSSAGVTYTGGGNVAVSLGIANNKITAGKLGGPLSNALPNGSSGQVLSSSGNGRFYWATQSSANNSTMTITAGDGLSTGGSFTGNQSSNSTVTLDLASSTAGTGLSFSSGVLAVEASQAITGVTGNFAIGGDLTVTGTTITTNTETLEIGDNKMVLNAGHTSTAVDTGLVIERGSSGNNKMLFWDESQSSFCVGENSTTAFPSSSAKVALQKVTSSLDTSDTSVPIGGFQVANGVAFLRTA